MVRKEEVIEKIDTIEITVHTHSHAQMQRTRDLEFDTGFFHKP